MHSALRHSLFLLFLLFVCSSVSAQGESSPIQSVKKLLNKQQYEKAYKMLSKYANNHPDDLDVQWLYGQVAYQSKHFDKAENIYEGNINKHQENIYLKIDYCNFLINIGKTKKAAELLKTYLPYVNDNPYIWLLLAKIQYWDGDYNTAETSILKAEEFAPANKDIRELKSEILNAKSPWISAGAIFSKDNQPIQVISSDIKGGYYFNQYASIDVDVQTPFYTVENDHALTYAFQLENKSYLSTLKLDISEEIGVLKHPFLNHYDYTWGISANKQVLKYLKLTAQGNRNPYYYTISSLHNVVMTTDATISAKWEKQNSFNGQVQVSNKFFDNNSIYNISSWLVSPPLKLKTLELRGGYGYSYTSSNKDQYQATETNMVYDDNGYFKGLSIMGAFSPYYTPIKQQVNSLIANMSFKPTSKLNVSLTGCYGIFASIYSPYLYGYYDENSNIVIKRGYQPTNYNPYNADFQFTWNISPTLNLKASYNYSNVNYYYSFQMATLSLKMNLWNK